MNEEKIANLKKELDSAQKILNGLAASKGVLTDEEVVAQSREVDALMNEYEEWVAYLVSQNEN